MRTLFILLALCLLAAPTLANKRARCTGSAACAACKNCKYCKHCNAGGGTCGVCAPGKPAMTRPNPRRAARPSAPRRTARGKSAPRSPSSAAVTTPARFGPEQKAILNALRAPVRKKAGVNVRFVVDHLKVGSNYAFFAGRTVDEQGQPVGPEYLDGETQALLRKRNGVWKALLWGLYTDTQLIDTARRQYPQAPPGIFRSSVLSATPDAR